MGASIRAALACSLQSTNYNYGITVNMTAHGFCGKYEIASSFADNDQGRILLMNLAEESWGYGLHICTEDRTEL